MGDAVGDERIAKSPCRGVTWCRSFVWVAAHTRLRWSEMIGLRRRDIDLLHRRINVSRQIVEVGSRFGGFDEPKTEAGKRSIDLPPFLCQIIEEQLERAQPGPDGLVFINTRRQPPHLSSFTSQAWKRARAKIGRPDLRWHDLRHTAVALAIANGAHPKAIQEPMGHSSITVTQDRYGHLFSTLGAKLADGLEPTFRAAQVAASNVRAIRCRVSCLNAVDPQGFSFVSQRREEEPYPTSRAPPQPISCRAWGPAYALARAPCHRRPATDLGIVPAQKV
jgi:Phage integrase family